MRLRLSCCRRYSFSPRTRKKREATSWAPSEIPRASSQAPPSRSPASTPAARSNSSPTAAATSKRHCCNPARTRSRWRCPASRRSPKPASSLAVGQQLSLELRIEVGQVAETVTVTADTPLLDTSSVSSGQNFDSRMVEGLPMFSNMPIMLTRFASGVNPSTNQSLVSQGFADGTTQAAGGAVGGVGSNNYSIDGATNNGSARRIAASPNSDMIQEMRVESSNFDASVGHGTGLQISMMTRAGANQFRGHGQLSVLVEQVQRAEPQPAVDLHAGRQGALRVRPFAQPRADGRRSGRDPQARQRPQQAVLLRQLLVRERLHSRQEPGVEHRAGECGAAQWRLLRSAQAAEPGAVPDLRSAHGAARSGESEPLHPRSVPQQHHSGEPDRQSALQPLPADGAAAQSEPDRERDDADRQLLPGRRA